MRPAVDRLDPHPPHHRRDPLPTDRDAFATQQIAQHPAARERMIEVQLIDPPHDRQISRRNRTGIVIQAATADPEYLSLSAQWQLVPAVNHRFALSNPALPSAADKKSFSSVNSPIFACSVFRSTPIPGDGSADPEPNTPAAPSNNCAFHAAICVVCTSYNCANSASVFSPLIAANDTLALNVGLWFRRDRLDMFPPATRQQHRNQAGKPLIGLFRFAQPPLISSLPMKVMVRTTAGN